MPEKHKKQQKPTPKRDDPEQSQMFISTARKHGADEEKSAADELLGRLAKTPHKLRKPD